ncbi:MAG: hypothetical protein ACREBU_02340 [Nitrososphaera sp.]
MQAQIFSFLRSLLKMGGAALAEHGFISEGNMETLTGAVIVIAGMIWSAITHKEA